MPESLARVYQVFDPAPLLPEDEGLYVDLDEVRGTTGFVARLSKRIRLEKRPTCQIVTGHRGSGKSTELRRLQRILEEDERRFFVVFCSLDEDVDRNDVDFPDVLIAIVRQMAQQLAQRADISLAPGYFKDRWERLKEVLGREVSFERLELSAGMLKISATAKGSPDARAQLRKLLEPDTANWIAAANDKIGEAKLELSKKGYGDLVIIVDELDKMVTRPLGDTGLTTAEYLFVHREAQLTAFETHLVYTMPLALAYSAQEQVLASLYGGHPPVIPMTKIRTPPPDSGPCEPGFQRFREVIAKRLAQVEAPEAEIFLRDPVRERLIELSGGQPTELMILMREALVGGDLPISEPAVERAARTGRRAYGRQLQREHWPILEEVRRTGSFTRADDNDRYIRDLLDSRAILQYANDEEWYAPNPLLEGLRRPVSA